MRVPPLLILTLLVGCGPGPETSADPEPTFDGCQAPDGVDDAPGTIEDMLVLMNALPRPLTVECFVESLERPMPVIGSLDTASAQPASGSEAPRLFAIYDTLVISFVPDGEGSEVVEFAEQRPLLQSVKAEVKMPVDEGDVTPSDAFDHLLQEEGGGTFCGTCHGNEQRAMDITYGEAYASQAFRPVGALTVTVDEVRAQHDSCDPDATPRRCSIYEAIFGQEQVVAGDFPRPLPTIVD